MDGEDDWQVIFFKLRRNGFILAKLFHDFSTDIPEDCYQNVNNVNRINQIRI